MDDVVLMIVRWIMNLFARQSRITANCIESDTMPILIDSLHRIMSGEEIFICLCVSINPLQVYGKLPLDLILYA